jgi:hypothetical protein
MRPPLLFVALSAVLLGSCFSAGDGQAPPLTSLYFPTGLALDILPSASPSDPPKYLFVASSDFDLQYRASSLITYNLEALVERIPQSCNIDSDCGSGTCDNDVYSALHNSAQASYFCRPSPDGEPCGAGLNSVHSEADLLLYPGRCASIDPAIATLPLRSATSESVSLPRPIIKWTVQIGAFATDVVFRATPASSASASEGRLFLPVRGDATLHWIDVGADGSPACGQKLSSGEGCDDAHRVGDDTGGESDNNLRQPPEPFAIAADDAGHNIAVTNQAAGSVSLFVNDWAATSVSETVKLQSILVGLPSAPVGIAALPSLPPEVPQEPTGFLTVYRDAAQIDLLRVYPISADPVNGGPYVPTVLARAATTVITANSVGSDSRGIVIDDSQRQIDYQACRCDGLSGTALRSCTAALANCLQAVHQPGVFVSNRAPASLLVGALGPDYSYASGTNDLPAFNDSIPLALGPSRVVLGKVRVASNASDAISDPSGSYVLEERVFVVCFDSRRIYIYDPRRRIVDAIVSTGRGPFALAIDEQRGLGYVAHFTDSYLGVISLDQRFPQNYAAIIASIGMPTPPRASK